MIKEPLWTLYGEPGLIPHGIVIHNSHANQELTARQLFDWYDSGTSGMNYATHIAVDSEETVDILPRDWKVISTGKGRDFAFNNCISITICTNIDDNLYLQGQQRAIELIKELMLEYGLTRNDIYFHIDFEPNYYCPANMLRLYGNKKNFLDEFLNS